MPSLWIHVEAEAMKDVCSECILCRFPGCPVADVKARDPDWIPYAMELDDGTICCALFIPREEDTRKKVCEYGLVDQHFKRYMED